MIDFDKLHRAVRSYDGLMLCPVCGEKITITGETKDGRDIGSCGDAFKKQPWVMFTKRTDDPKLAWLERQLDAASIPHRRNGHSFHAPILEVRLDDLERAWEILTPVDDIDDDDPRFHLTTD